MDEKPLQQGNKYILQHHSRQIKCVVKEIEYKLDVNTLEKIEPDIVKLNEVVKVLLKTATPLVYDSYENLRANGGAILIDETSHSTVAAVLFQ